MAISYTVLHYASTTSSGSTVVTPSISPSSNKLLIAIIGQRFNGGAGDNSFLLAGCGLTWVRMVDKGTGSRNLAIYRSMGSPSSGALTWTKDTGQTFFGNATCAVIEFDGVPTGGTNGSAAVGTPSNSASTTTSFSLALTGTPSTGDVAFVSVATADDRPVTRDSAYDNINTVSSNEMTLTTDWDTGQDTPYGCSFSSGESLIGAFWILTAGGGGGPTAFPHHYYQQQRLA